MTPTIEPKKKKILFWADSVTIETGFSQVAKRLCRILYETGKYDIEQVAVNNFSTYYSQKEYPYIVHTSPANDPFNMKMIQEKILAGGFDILFCLNDLNIVNEVMDYVAFAKKEGKKFVVVVYCPIDTDLAPRDHMRCLVEADYPVVYTKWGLDVCVREEPKLKKKLRYIYHGTEPELFFPLSEEDKRTTRKNALHSDDEVFTVVNVNRNQWRKDLWRTMKIFHRFHQIHPKSKLYMHAKQLDVGGHLPSQAYLSGLTIQGEDAEIVFTDPKFNESYGVPRPMMNAAYNAANVIVSTTLNEGFGLSLVEAFCAKIPVVFPRNSSLMELIGENEERGYFAECGTNENEWCIAYGASNYPRPLTNQASMLEKLELIYNDREGLGYKGQTAEKVQAAYDWAMKNKWSDIGKEWLKLFDEIK